VKTNIVIFPFDLFGGGGAAAGALLLADALREMQDDNHREAIPTRARVYKDSIRIKEFNFDRLEAYTAWQTDARRAIRQTWRKQEFLLWVGGNHLATLPLYRELAESREDVLVIQFDAHLDIYNLSDCTSELSHGNFLLHCGKDLPAIVNLGHRDLFLTAEHVRRYYHQVFAATELAIDLEPALKYLRQQFKKARRIFIDIDCDVFDPAFFPALGHPLPFGLAPLVLVQLLDTVEDWDRVIGMSVSEFDPARDATDRSLQTLVWLVEYLLLKRYENSASSPAMTS
jgi:arginase family enzyme